MSETNEEKVVQLAVVQGDERIHASVFALTSGGDIYYKSRRTASGDE